MSFTPSLTEGAERIAQVAAPLFATHGYSGVSISDIANAAGTSKANIFHHFPNKKALYLESIRRVCEGLRAAFDHAGTERGSRNSLTALAGLRLQQMFDEPDAMRLILREVFVGEKGIDRSAVAEILHQNFEQFVEQIRAEQRAGSLRADVDPALAALTVIAVNNLLFQSWPIMQRFEEFARYGSVQECAAATFDTLSNGLINP